MRDRDDDNEGEKTYLDTLSKTLARLMDRDPLSAITRCQKEFREQEIGHVKMIRLLVYYAYQFAIEAKQDESAIGAFYKNGFFDARKRKPKPKDLLRMTTCYMVGTLQKSPKYDRALSYEKLLRPYYERNAPAEEVKSELADHGIDRLYRWSVDEGKAEKGKPTRGTGRNDGKGGSGDDVGSTSRPSAPREGSGGAVATNPGRAQTRTTRQGSDTVSGAAASHQGPILEVEMFDDEDLEKVLDIPIGGQALITVTRVEGEGDWVPIHATKVEVLGR